MAQCPCTRKRQKRDPHIGQKRQLEFSFAKQPKGVIVVLFFVFWGGWRYKQWYHKGRRQRHQGVH